MSSSTPPSTDRPISQILVVLLGSAVTLVVLAVVLPHLWYNLHAISDVPLYHSYAARIALGEAPYSDAFRIEYPPLAVPILTAPGHTDDVDSYVHWFTLWMGGLTTLAAALTAYAAARLWPVGRRAYRAALLFPLAVALTGAIIVNRYDAAVAVIVAGFLVCLVRRWYTLAALALGLGFALKMTPLAIVPLLFLVVRPTRRLLLPGVAFTVAAVAPFVPYLLDRLAGIMYVFRYHLERPLQIESVLGTPLLIGQLLGAGWAKAGYSHGSHSLEAPLVGFLASASGGLTLLAVAAVYALAWRRRERIRASAGEQMLVVLALLLALITFSKVLSPQYMIWLLPAWALVAVRDRSTALLGGLVLLLTQVEFPALYGPLLSMRPAALAVVSARNILLVAWFALTLWRLWQIKAVPNAEVPAAATPLGSPVVGRPRRRLRRPIRTARNP